METGDRSRVRPTLRPSEAQPNRTLAWSRLPPASAPASLPLPAAAEARRSRAKTSLASLAGGKSLSGQGEPPTRSESCVHGGGVVGHTAHKMGAASTEHPVGRRGDRAPCRAGTASPRRVADAEGFHAPAGHTRPTVRARWRRSAGVRRPWQAGSEASQHVGSPSGSWPWPTLAEGLQLLRHGRGNPDTAPGWPLRATVDQGTGQRSRTVTGPARRRRLGWLSTPRTPRWGQPTTRGRT